MHNDIADEVRKLYRIIDQDELYRAEDSLASQPNNLDRLRTLALSGTSSLLRSFAAKVLFGQMTRMNLVMDETMSFLLYQASPLVREGAVWGLQKAGRSDILRSVARDDQNELVRSAALEALDEMGG